MGQRALTVWLESQPYSMDPAQYDASIHHISARPCFSSLVTQYRNGTIAGVVAESWSNSTDLRQWTFTLRQGLHYDNGDSITPESVRLSLTRMAWLQHQSGSRSGVTEHLVGVSALRSASGTFEGVKTTDRAVVLNFEEAQPKLLEAISFGLYGVVHPHDYDPVSGAWLRAKSLISSGPYSIKEWGEKSLVLTLRSNFPAELRHPNAAHQLTMVWDQSLRTDADIVMGSSLETDLRQHDEFYGPGAKSASIMYVQAFSWNHADSPLKDRSLRVALRTAFYDALVQAGVQPIRSFLPLTLPGISEAQQEAGPENRQGSKFTIRAVDPNQLRPSASRTAQVAITSAISRTGGEYVATKSLTHEERDRLYNPDAQSYLVDVAVLGTGILIEDPVADVKFMILSKEGIALPDPTGRLKAAASKASPDLAEINRVIWDDAVVWPVAHYTAGLWVRRGSADMSQINLSLPPTDLSFIGAK